MTKAAECVCCSEIDHTAQKLNESEANVNCITEDEGLEPVCLNVWLLQAGLYSYEEHYGMYDIQCEPEHE